ncbi:MAG: hypothetical protein WCO89_07180 [Syntrophus sp. (in: bacteria)]
MGRLNDFLDQFQKYSGDAPVQTAEILHDFHEGTMGSPENAPVSRGSDETAGDRQETETDLGACQCLWEDVQRRLKASLEKRGEAYPAAEEGGCPDLINEDMRLRKAIFAQLQNPRVRFRDFSKLVYQWRNLILGGNLPERGELDLPSWKASKKMGDGGSGLSEMDSEGEPAEVSG